MQIFDTHRLETEGRLITALSMITGVGLFGNKTILTGTRGGKYYINKNGNKTNIKY